MNTLLTDLLALIDFTPVGTVVVAVATFAVVFAFAAKGVRVIKRLLGMV